MWSERPTGCEAVEEAWRDLMAEVDGAYDAEVRFTKASNDMYGASFEVKSRMREGIGMIALRLSPDFIRDTEAVRAYLKFRLRDDAVKACPYMARQLSKEVARA